MSKKPTRAQARWLHSIHGGRVQTWGDDPITGLRDTKHYPVLRSTYLMTVALANAGWIRRTKLGGGFVYVVTLTPKGKAAIGQGGDA